MKVYFCGSIRGDRSKREIFCFIVETLQKLGHEVLTPHIVSDDPKESKIGISHQEVYKRDIELLLSSDSVIAEVSAPSFGVGFEVGYIIAKGGKKVYLFYDKKLEEEDKISSLARGCTDTNCKIIPYSSKEDILEGLKNL